jgi:uncharacterized membrane protein
MGAMTRSDLARTVLGVLFMLAGVLHFVMPSRYRAIVPPYLPAPAALVAVSGAAEIAGGLGLLLARLRQMAGVGLILLLVAVFPANVEMLLQARQRGVSGIAELLLWARLPLQVVLVWSIWRLSQGRPPRP